MKTQYNNKYGYKEDLPVLYSIKWTKSNTILSSHKHASISLFKLLQFNLIGQFQRLAVGLLVFFSFYQYHILPIYLHICHIYVGPNSTYM